MSVLWKVQLLSLEDKKCTLKIKNVHSNDENIPTEPAFMIQIIHDACLDNMHQTFEFPKGTLFTKISTSQSCDIDYLEKVANQYIESIEIIREQNEENIEALVTNSLENRGLEMESDEWEDAYEAEIEKYSIESVVEITMSHQKYIDHLFPIEHKGRIINRPNWDSFACL
jgi:hypothetical protein